MRRLLSCLLSVLLAACATLGGDPARIVTVDHFVTLKSNAPSLPGGDSQLYVRELVRADTLEGKSFADKVVLMVHGAGTPAEVSFDIVYKDYSWMAYLAKEGYDVFAVSLTGYGASTRPPAMADPCNIAKEQQAQFVPSMIPAACPPSHPIPLTTQDSDLRDLEAVVDHLLAMRGVKKVAIVGWSQGGPRGAGYAARHPEKVSTLFMLAPAYRRDGRAGPPEKLAAPEGPMNVQSFKDFTANWNRQVGCADQREPEMLNAVWTQLIASDPVGAKWGSGVRRAPTAPYWGFNKDTVARMQTPFAMVTGPHDAQVEPARVRALYEDLGSPRKVFIDLACTGHQALWEKNHTLLFKASAEWLKEGKVNGVSQGMVKLGY